MYRFNVEINGLTRERAYEIIYDRRFPVGGMIGYSEDYTEDFTVLYDHRLKPREVKQILKNLDPEDFTEITIK